MAETNSKDVLNEFDIHLLSTEYSEKFCIKWTLNNFSKFSSDLEFESPLLNPKSEYKCRLFLKKVNDEELCLSLKNLSCRTMRAETLVSIFDSDGKLWHSQDDSSTYEPEETIDILDCDGIYEKLLSLKDDILILICNFKIIRTVTINCPSHNLQINGRKKYNGRKKLYEDLKILCDRMQHADVSLTVNGVEVPAHKAILSVRSAAFRKMFRHNMDEEDGNCVQIDDVPLPVFKKLIEFMYVGEVDSETDFAAASALYHAADKYEILDLREMCADTLLSLITVDNVIEMVVDADRLNDEYLKERALDYLYNNVNCIMGSGKWDEFVTTKTQLASQVLERWVKVMGLKS